MTSCDVHVLLGHSWAAACTEGMLVYSLNATLLFDPHDITTEVTPEAVETALAGGDHLTALVLSFKLGDVALTQRTLEAVPTNNGMPFFQIATSMLAPSTVLGQFVFIQTTY